MNMIKKLARCVREYKKATLLTLLFIIGEAVIETLIPFITANLINSIQRNGVDMGEILKTGAILILMALCSLLCGGIAGFTCAKASAGFAKNLRSDIFGQVQTFTFANIDKFSTGSLITMKSGFVVNSMVPSSEDIPHSSVILS